MRMGLRLCLVMAESDKGQVKSDTVQWNHSPKMHACTQRIFTGLMLGSYLIDSMPMFYTSSPIVNSGAAVSINLEKKFKCRRLECVTVTGDGGVI